MTTDELKQLLQPVREIAIQAGTAILDIYHSGDWAVTAKADATPLTEADIAAHHVVVAGLQQLQPQLPVLSEESDETIKQARLSWDRYWLIDPLDGTKEFIAKTDEFTVNIALIDGHQSILGLVYAPVLGVTYMAARGTGAFKQVENSDIETIAVRTKPAEKFVVATSRRHAKGRVDAAMQEVGGHDMLPMGSSLKFGVIAEGKADIYPRLGPTCEWDTAAAQCVLEEAGGAVLNLAGQPLQYNAKDELLNPYFVAIGDTSVDWLGPLNAHATQK